MLKKVSCGLKKWIQEKQNPFFFSQKMANLQAIINYHLCSSTSDALLKIKCFTLSIGQEHSDLWKNCNWHFLQLPNRTSRLSSSTTHLPCSTDGAFFLIKKIPPVSKNLDLKVITEVNSSVTVSQMFQLETLWYWVCIAPLRLGNRELWIV